MTILKEEGRRVGEVGYTVGNEDLIGEEGSGEGGRREKERKREERGEKRW